MIDVAAPVVGLTDAQADERRRLDGPNSVPTAPPPRIIRRIGRQLADPFVLLLLAASAVTIGLGDWPDTAVIALVVLVNTAVGVSQELRADQAIDALHRLCAPTARVVRGGVDRIVPAADLVRGDVVRLAAGDVVPADMAVTVAHELRLDQSVLTGESVPVAITVGDEAPGGAVVTGGRAIGEISRVGADSGLGRIAALVASAGPATTPLQRRLARLSRTLGLVAVGLSGIVFAIGVASGRSVAAMAITAVSLVVAAVPESLPVVVTLALALGARRMVAAHAIPRRLHAVETLGSVTTVASDKTGTLTEGRMAVEHALTTDLTRYAVGGAGYAPVGQLTRADGRPAEPAQLTPLAEALVLCNNAELRPPTDGPAWSAVGDPLEAALLAFAGRCGLDIAATRAAHPRVAEQPFDQGLRRMSTVHRRPDGSYLRICKGAPEAVLTSAVVDVNHPRVAALLRAGQALAAEGVRVLAVAAAPVGSAMDNPPLVPLGLVGVGDPLRPAALATVAAFDTAGVDLVMVTGDHPDTAASIGAQLGIWNPGDPVATGPGPVDGARVFARVAPDQKLSLVIALQQAGHVVAVTGDGVNDAPALRQADIGVAMGGGTEVAQQAADLILVDDNLGTVAVAIGEGRRIYDNIRRFLRYGLAGGTAEILVMLAGPLLGLGLPLLPAQILWINLLTHGLPGVALGAEPAEPDVLRRPPLAPDASVLGRGLAGGVVAAGALIAATALGAGVYGHATGRPWQSMVFVVLGLAQLGFALAVRARRTRRGRDRNPALWAAVALSAILQVAGVLLPPLHQLLGTTGLTVAELGICALFGVVPGLLMWVLRHRPVKEKS